MKCLIRLNFFLLLAFSFNTWAQQTIQIESDSAQYDHHQGTMTHTGHVVVHWQDRILMADKLVIHKNAQGELSQLIAHGRPATFEGSVTQKSKKMSGQARLIEFKFKPNTVTLKDHAQLEYFGDMFQGPIIRFDFNTQSIFADKQDTVRPKLIFGANLSNFTDKSSELP